MFTVIFSLSLLSEIYIWYGIPITNWAKKLGSILYVNRAKAKNKKTKKEEK